MAVVTTWGVQDYAQWRRQLPPQSAPGITDGLPFYYGHLQQPRLPMADFGVGTITDNTPIALLPQAAIALGVERQPSFLNDYYNRIHIQPPRVDLGNVVSIQVISVEVWSAFFDWVTLSDIAGLEEGLILAGQPAPPLQFAPLQLRTWQLSITPDGQPVLDTALVWQFTLGAEARLPLTANRIIAFTFAPDWSEGIAETLTWRTDILASESLAEQRRALRPVPRREFAASVIVDGRERQLLDLYLYGWGSRVWALPVWWDVQWTDAALSLGATRIPCVTADLDFAVGRLAILRGETAFNFEVVEVAGIDAAGIDLARPTQQAWPAGVRLYPARAARLVEEPQRTRLTDLAQRIETRFRATESCEWPAALPATLYRGRPLLADRPDESEELTASYARLLAELDNESAIPLTLDVAGRALPVQRHRWLGLGRAERAAYRALLYGLSGRQVPVWVPTHAADLELVDEVLAEQVTMDIAWIGYTRFGQMKPGRRDIRIELTDGTVLHRRITGATELGTEAERLVLDAAPGRLVQLADVARMSWMALCRLDSDTVEILHLTDSEGAAQSQLTFRGVRDDEF